MRILHVLYDDPRNPWTAGSGAATRAIEINRRLAAAGHRITMVTGNFPMAGGEEAWDGLRFLRTGHGETARRSRATFAHGAEMVLHTVAHDLLVHDLSPLHPVRSWELSPAPVVGIVHAVNGAAWLVSPPFTGLLRFVRERRMLRRIGRIIASSPTALAALTPRTRADAVVELIAGETPAAPDWDALARRHMDFYERAVSAG